MNIGGTFWKLMNEGGPVMWPLLAFSVIALAVVGERLYALWRARINVHEFLPKVRKALVLKAGLMKYGQPKEDIEKTIENAALFEMGRLERGLAVLATTANVAPLLGFFGTVTGMMAGFDALAAQGLSNPGAVATGIKEALTTTAGGLAVAIPTQLAYNYFMSRINKFVRDIETAANMLLETFGEMERSGISPDSGEGS